MMTNRRPGNCRVCSTYVAAQEGFVEKIEGAWVCFCAKDAQALRTNAMVIEAARVADGRVVFNPRGYLGGEFDRYRKTISEAGAAWSREANGNVTTLQATGRVIETLRAANFQVSVHPDLAAALAAHEASMASSMAEATGHIADIERRSGWTFFPFQHTGVEFLAARVGALLADDMGLGKTCQVLGALPEGAAVVVVAPATAKGTWTRELKRVRPEFTVRTMSGGKEPFVWPKANEVVVLNYDILRKVLPTTWTAAPANLVVVADEAHRLKNRKAAMTVAFKTLLTEARKTPGTRTWGVTATPMLNDPWELYGLLEMFDCATEAFGPVGNFINLFNGYKDGWGGWHWGTPRDTAIQECLRRVMIRRMKVEVLKDLPAKRYEERFVSFKETAALKAALKTLGKRLAAEGYTGDLEEMVEAACAHGEPRFTEFAAVRAALAAAKIPALEEVVEEYEEAHEPLVVFSAHRAPIDYFASRPGWCVITGDTSPDERTRLEEEFQAGKYIGCACTIQAGGVALTLTRASNSLFVDELFTPSLNEQAEDRVYRIGQMRGVVITRLVSEHPVDLRLYTILNRKRHLIRHSVDAARVTDSAAVEKPVFATSLDVVAPLVLPPPAAPVEDDEPEFVTEDEVSATEVAPVAGAYRASTPAEQWAATALATLAAADADGAQARNAVGFNRIDTLFGHAMAVRVANGLTSRQWAAVLKMLVKYSAQVGAVPADGVAA